MFPLKRTIELKPLDQGVVDSGTEELRSLIEPFGLSIDEEKLNLCVQHLLYVLQVNEYINLTAIKEFNDGLVLHLLDSLLFDLYLPSHGSDVLDMGTGAGFPGLPIACTTDLSVGMIDSVGKKVNVVNAIIDKLELSNARAVHERVESFGSSHKSSFDYVVARALAPLPILLEYARPFLKQHGSLVVSKGEPNEDELKACASAAGILGFKLQNRDDFELPRGLGHRSLFVFEAYKPSSIRLPRQIGAARKNPLA